VKQLLLAGACVLAAGPAWAADVVGEAAAAEAVDNSDAAQVPVTRDDEGAADAPFEDRDEIIVTGTRSILPATALPLTVDVLGGDEFDEQVLVSGSVIDAVAARMPAFSPTREKLSGSGESLRGRSPLFAINGVPQSTPIRDGSRDGYTIDPFFVERVEVIYGSNALQGIGATGGVVNQVTVGAPAFPGWSVRTLNQTTAQDGFSGDNIGAKTGALAAYRSGAFDMTAGATFERRGAFLDGEGRIIGVDGTQGDVQDSDSWSLFGRFGYQLTDSARIELVANRFELEGNNHYVVVPGFPTTSEKGETPGATPSNRAELLSLSFNDEDLAGGNLVAQAFFSRTRDIFGGGTFATFQDPDLDASARLFEQSVNNSRKLGAKLSYQREVPGLEALVMTVGVDALADKTAQTLLHTGRVWVPESEFRSLAPFVQGNLKLFDGLLRLAGGARYEDVKLKVGDFQSLDFYGRVLDVDGDGDSDDDDENGDGVPDNFHTYQPVPVGGGSPSFNKLLWNGGVVLEPVDGLRAYAAYAEGYTIADVGRILRGITEEGVDVDTFLSLEPVVSNNRELGVEWRRGAISASASYWWSDSDLGSRLRRGADGIFSVVRAPISLQGLDLSVDWRTPVEGLTLGGAYAHVKGRTDDDGDGSLESDLDGANIAPDRLNLHAGLERGAFSARLASRIYFEREFDGPAFAPADNFEGFTLFDALVGYRVGRHRVHLGVQNLTDKDYITYYSDTVGNDDLSYFAGRGRTFTLGVTSEF
jgi:iron complex outermembrane receptor protein